MVIFSPDLQCSLLRVAGSGVQGIDEPCTTQTEISKELVVSRMDAYRLILALHATCLKSVAFLTE